MAPALRPAPLSYPLVREDFEPLVTAADHGFLAVVEYLHGLGCEWSTGVCNVAAQRGALGILRFAHENGCPWSAETCKAAGDLGACEHLAAPRPHCLCALSPRRRHPCPLVPLAPARGRRA